MTGTPWLILASASPRRRELLGCLGVEFSVVPAEIDETEPEVVDNPVAFAESLARTKAREVGAQHSGSVVLAADTIVVMDGRILGKPADATEARRTLESLRGRTHQVTTAIALTRGSNESAEHVTTDVVMRDYSDQQIVDYIASGDPFDKAGSYAIQDQRFHPVERCAGCYCNVVGLPILLVHPMLQRAGVDLPALKLLNLPPECRICPLSETHNTAGGKL